jgi:MFS family permease
MTTKSKLPGSPSFRRPFYGWFVAAAGAIAVFCSAPGQSYGFAIFIDTILRDTGLTRSQLSALYALGTGVSALTSFVVGRMVDQWGARRMLALVGLGFGAACFVMAGAGGWLSVLLGFATLRALGQGSLSIISTLLVAQWFVQYRGRAMAFIQLGGAAANASFPPLALALILAVGWRDAYRMLGIALWCILIPLAYFVVRNRPEALGLHVDGLSPLATEPVHRLRGEESAEVFAPEQALWRSSQFWSIALPLVAAPFIITALVFHQTSIFASRGLPSTIAAGAFVPQALASALTATATGFVIDRLGPRTVLFGALGLLFLAVLQLQTLTTALGATIYAITMGCVGGTTGVASGVIWAHYYGREGLGRIQGAATMVMISAAAMAPLPLAVLQRSNGSYSLGLGLYALLPLVCAAILTRLKRKPRISTEPGQS